MLPGPLAPDLDVPYRRHLGDSVGMLMAALLACWLFARGLWHGLDGYQFLSDIDHGQLFHDRHVLYKPVAWLIASTLQPLGLSLFDSVVAASAIGTAIGAFFAHRALLGLGLPRRDAALAGIAIAGCFSVLYFATVVEIHGVFFGFAGLAWWAFGKFSKHPSWTRALLCGCACGLTAAAHATGHLLLGTFYACALAWCWQRMRQTNGVFVLGALAVGHFATAALVTTIVMRLTGTIDPAQKKGLFEGPIGYVGNMLGLATDWSTTGPLFVQEWLRPFLPLSLFPLLALTVPRLRREGALLCVCVAVYLAAAVVLLSPTETLRHPQYLPPLTLIEYGAYFLPLAVPAAIVGVRMLPARLRVLLPLATIAWAAWLQLHPDRPVRDDAFGNAVIELVEREQHAVLCGGFAEIDSVKRLRPSLAAPQFIYAYEWQVMAFTNRRQMTPAVAQRMFDADYLLAQQKGGLLVTADALRILRATHDGMFDALVDGYIPAHYELQPYEHGAFRGFRVVKRP